MRRATSGEKAITSSEHKTLLRKALLPPHILRLCASALYAQTVLRGTRARIGHTFSRRRAFATIPLRAAAFGIFALLHAGTGAHRMLRLIAFLQRGARPYPAHCDTRGVDLTRHCGTFSAVAVACHARGCTALFLCSHRLRRARCLLRAPLRARRRLLCGRAARARRAPDHLSPHLPTPACRAKKKKMSSVAAASTRNKA